MTKQIKRKVNRDKLRSLGVPEVLFEPAEYLTEQGAFEVEPPRELVESTITLCLEELKSKLEFPMPTIDPTAILWPAVRDCAAQLFRLGPLPATYADALFYVSYNVARPLLIVENHDLVPPSFWRKEELVKAREAFRQINTYARSLHRPASCRVMVLKSCPDEYTSADMRELVSSLKEGTSDVYCIPSRDAGEFSKKDVVVVGDLRVLSISKKPSTVHEAEQMLLESKKEDSTEALALRTRIEVLTHHALPVKSNGVLVGEFAGVLSADDSTAACETMLMTLNHAAGR